MKILVSALLCLCSLVIFAQQDTPSGENIKKNGFLSSLVVDEAGMPLIVQIDITDNVTNEIVQQFQSSRIGYSRISLPSGNYNIVFSKQGYLFHSENFVILDTAGYEKKLKKVVLKKVEVGNNTVLKNIAFEDNQSVLKEASFKDLQRVLELMNEIVTIQIEISGDIGKDEQVKTNKELAEQRGKVLIDYLVSKGVDRNRLKYTNNVEQPIELVDSEEPETDDSKVQVKIVDIGPQKLVQTEGQYYAVPAEPVKKKKGKKNKTDQTTEEALKAAAATSAGKAAEPEPGKETTPDNTAAAVEKKEEKVPEEPGAEVSGDIVKKEEPPVTEPKETAETETKEPVKTEAAEPSEDNSGIVTSEKKEEPVPAEETVPVKTEAVNEEKESTDIVAVDKKDDASEAQETRKEEQKTEEVAAAPPAETEPAKAEEAVVAVTEKKAEAPAGQEQKETGQVDVAGKSVTEGELGEKKEAEPASKAEENVAIKEEEKTIAETPVAETAAAGVVEQKDEQSLVKPVNNAETNGGENPENKSGETAEASDVEPDNTKKGATLAVRDTVKKESVKEKNVLAGIPVDTTVYDLEGVRADIGFLGESINSAFPDYAPLISADGNTMVFTSRRPLNKKDVQKGRVGKENIYISHYDNRGKVWSPAEMMDATINIPESDNTATAISADGQRILIYRAKDDKNPSGDIYESVLNGDVWAEPVKLSAPINSNAEETFAAISADGQTLYFVSDRKGGLGGKDIWSCTKDKSGKWGEAINLGPTVNSSKDEETVFMHPNGSTMFFSSRGHQSPGGADIFMATFDESTGRWGRITNMGNSVNTEGDDLYFVMAANSKTAYNVSYEQNGSGNNDIFCLNFVDTIVPQSTVLLKGTVIDENGRVIKSKITFADQNNDKPLGLFSSNRATGKYVVPLPAGKNYNVKFSAKGYTSFVEPLETKGLPYAEFSKIILLESRNTYLTGKAVDVNGAPLSVLVEAIDKSNKQWIEKTMNDEEGNWRIAVPAGKNYGIVLSKPGYFFYTINTTMPNAIGYERDFKTITLTKIESGKKVVLNNVAFEPGKAALKQEIFSDLDLVVKLMTEMPTLQIEISDNANNLAASKPFQQLSKDRAKAMSDYLVSRGCDIKRIKYASYDTKEPVASTGKKGEFASRAELKVLKLDEKAEQQTAESRIKEITEEIKRINEANAFGEDMADSLNGEGEDSEFADGTEEAVDTAVVSEYGDSTMVDSMAVDSVSEEFAGEVVDSTALMASDSIQMTIRNMGSLINSPFADYAPLVSADGTKLFFTSNRPLYAVTPSAPPKGKIKTPEYKSSIYTSDYEENQEHWLMAVPLKQGVNLENENNTAIAVSNDSKRLLMYRSTDRANTPGDIMETTSPNVDWAMPMVVLSSLNSPALETAASYSPDGRTIYFVSDRQGGAGMKDIWYCTQNEKGVWGDAVNIGEPVNTDKDEESVFIHPNGNTLFFSSKGHNTTGGYDIYMTEHNDSSDTWEQPRNLGSFINTPEDDLYFVLAADGKTGYYSAIRPDGLGKEDIYQVLMEQSILKKNTTILKGVVMDEAGQVLRAKITVKDKATGKVIGTYTSTASNGKYAISLPEGKNYEIKVLAPDHTAYVRTIDLTDKKRYDELKKNIVLETRNAFLTSKVYNEAGQPISKVQIEVIDKTAKQLIDRAESDSEGYSRIAIPSNKTIDVIYRKPGYLFQSVSVVLPKFEPNKEYEKDLKTITLQKMEVGKKTVLSNISYDFNQTTLSPESFLDLSRVVTMMNNMPSLQVEVSDHTDNTAESKEMQKLSKDRAKAVADRLISMGADKKRIKYKSYGALQPIAPNGSEQGRAMNRRVELKILKIDAATEIAAEEKRWREEQPLMEETESNNPFINESMVEKKDSTTSAATKEEVKEEPVQNKKDESETGVMPGLDGVVTEEPAPAKKETEVVNEPEDTKSVTKEERVQNKKDEPETGVMPGLDGVVTEEPAPANKETEVVSEPEESKSVTKEEPVQNKKDEQEVGVMPGLDGIVTEEPAPAKKETEVVDEPEETKAVSKEEPVQNKKEEPEVGVMPGLDGVVTEEPAPAKKETEVVSEPEETKAVTKEEPVQNKKEEPEVGVMPGLDGVVTEEPAPAKKETEVVSEPEETKAVTKEEPVQNKKEEPEVGVMPGLDGVVQDEPVQNKKEEPEVGVMPGLDGVVSDEPGTKNEEKKGTVTKSSLPDRFVKFDSDRDGTLSANEIYGAIDAFFDDNSTIVADDINAMIDYFFDN
jgi:outer membrane protein OmpA-like peptidoglycan-associated protein/Tol biopolymer transport system component